MDFTGRAGLVTGAGSGIGRTSARRLASAGGFVVVADVDEDGGEETVALIEAAGGDSVFVRCDVTCSAEVKAAARRVVQERGRLDFAHNNAGVPCTMHSIDELPEEAFDHVVAVNLKGVWLCLKHEIPIMRAQGRGAIVNTASVCGFRVAPNTSPYNATKHAVIGLTKEAALEVAELGIRVNAVCPGFIRTPMSLGTADEDGLAALGRTVPLGRVGDPGEIAEVVAWLLSDAASYVNGHSLVADGGLIQGMPGPSTV